MAVALSLLIVLPGLAQSQGYDDTRGMLSSGDSLTVAVLNGEDDVPDTDNVDESVAGSYFDGTLYVSNDEDAHNTVRITATGGSRSVFNGPDGIEEDADRARDATGDAIPDGRNESTDNVNCAVATVKNNRTNKRITLRLDNATPTSADAGTVAEMVIFEVTENGTMEYSNGTRECGEQAGETVTTATLEAGDTTYTTDNAADAIHGRIPARHGDTLTVTVAGVSGSVQLTVDAEGPEFSEISPADGIFINSQTVKFRFVVADTDSGLAHDGELDYSRGDDDARAVNGDDDNFTSGEPRTALTSLGEARDIDVMFLGSDQSALGTSGWRQRGGRPGVSYFVDMAVTNVDENTHITGTWRPGTARATPAAPRPPTRVTTTGSRWTFRTLSSRTLARASPSTTTSAWRSWTAPPSP